VKRIILDPMKDQFIPHILDKKLGESTFDALVKLIQNYFSSQQMILQNQLLAIRMSKTNTMVNYLTINELKDQLATIGTKVEDQEIVSMLLLGCLLFMVIVLGRTYQISQSFRLILCRKKSDCSLVRSNKGK